LPKLCKEEPPAQAGGFLFPATLRNRLVRFLAGPPHTPRGKPGSQWRTLYLVEFVSYENDYIADLSMQRIGLKLIVNTTFACPLHGCDSNSLGAGGREFKSRRPDQYPQSPQPVCGKHHKPFSKWPGQKGKLAKLRTRSGDDDGRTVLEKRDRFGHRQDFLQFRVALWRAQAF